MDGYNFFDYVPTSDNEEENDVVPSVFHNVVENIQIFDNDQWEENQKYTVMEVVPHGFTGNVSFFMCIFVIYKIHLDFQ